MELMDALEMSFLPPFFGPMSLHDGVFGGQTIPSASGGIVASAICLTAFNAGPGPAQMGTPTGALMDPLLGARILAPANAGALLAMDKFLSKVSSVLFAHYR